MGSPSRTSIDHWQDKAAGLREIRRVLRPNGRLVVVKDGGLPGSAKTKLTFLAELCRSGLKVLLESDLVDGDVRCTVWTCGTV